MRKTLAQRKAEIDAAKIALIDAAYAAGFVIPCHEAVGIIYQLEKAGFVIAPTTPGD